jgi:hypothetical protein
MKNQGSNKLIVMTLLEVITMSCHLSNYVPETRKPPVTPSPHRPTRGYHRTDLSNTVHIGYNKPQLSGF